MSEENLTQRDARCSITSDDLKENVDASNLIFDLKVVYDGFKNSIADKDQISMDHYLRGYTELNK